MIPPQDRVVLITGAVGNLGLAVAQILQRTGYKTVLLDRSLDRLTHCYPHLKDVPHHALIGDVDLNDATSIQKAVEATLSRFGRLDALVHTVGGYRGGRPVHEEELATWDFLFNVNLRTTLLCNRAVIPVMIRQGYGRVVNVASRAALQGSAGYAAYAASKSAVLRLTESLSEELKRHGINVNCLLPGTIDTPQNRQASPQADFSTWVEPAALADVVQFLLSDAARAVTGAALPVYGKG